MKSSIARVGLLAAALLAGCRTAVAPPVSDSAPSPAGSEVTDAPANTGVEAGPADARAVEDRDVVADRFEAADVIDAWDAGVVDLADAADAADAVACRQASDCRLYSSECGGCNCLSLVATDPDPVCNGHAVQCLVDPCRGHAAACDDGHCASR